MSYDYIMKNEIEMSDFRALCAELIDELDFQTSHHEVKELKARARAALAAEPVGEGLEPTHEQVSQWINANPVLRPGSTGGPMIRVGTDWLAAFADAARWGAQFCPAPIARARAALAQPVELAHDPRLPTPIAPIEALGPKHTLEAQPVGPKGADPLLDTAVRYPDEWASVEEPQFTAEEVALHQAPWSYLMPPQPVEGLADRRQERQQPEMAGDELLKLANDKQTAPRLISAYDKRTTPRPVPVSERLPGPKDLDDNGRCWVYQNKKSTTHWLPATALPLPEAQP